MRLVTFLPLKNIIILEIKIMNFRRKAFVAAIALFFTIGLSNVYAQATSQQETSSTSKVSDSDLEKFVAVYPELLQQNLQVQQQMMAIAASYEMSLDRFGEVQIAKMDNKEIELTEKEERAVEEINQKIEELQPEMKEKAEKSIVGAGLTTEKFNEIVEAIQNNQELQQKVQEMMMAAQD